MSEILQPADDPRTGVERIYQIYDIAKTGTGEYSLVDWPTDDPDVRGRLKVIAVGYASIDPDTNAVNVYNVHEARAYAESIEQGGDFTTEAKARHEWIDTLDPKVQKYCDREGGIPSIAYSAHLSDLNQMSLDIPDDRIVYTLSTESFVASIQCPELQHFTVGYNIAARGLHRFIQKASAVQKAVHLITSQALDRLPPDIQAAQLRSMLAAIDSGKDFRLVADDLPADVVSAQQGRNISLTGWRHGEQKYTVTAYVEGQPQPNPTHKPGQSPWRYNQIFRARPNGPMARDSLDLLGTLANSHSLDVNDTKTALQERLSALT